MTSTSVSSIAVAPQGSLCSSDDHCLPQLYCLNYTCSCPQSCADVAAASCPCSSAAVVPPVLSAAARAYWPSVVLVAILLLAALTTVITCLAHTIARKFTKNATGRTVPLPEISTLGDAYGTDTLYCTPSPTATPGHTPWATPVPTPRFNFFHRKGSCPNPILRGFQFGNTEKVHHEEGLRGPFLFHAAMPVMSCALAPVKRTSENFNADDCNGKHKVIDGDDIEKLRRSTLGNLYANNEPMLQNVFSSQTDLYSLSTSYEHNRGYLPLISRNEQHSKEETKTNERTVPTSLDIEVISTPKLTSISSNDTFLTANTGTPQENSKYSFHSLMDSSLDSYLTLSLSSPNASPPPASKTTDTSLQQSLHFQQQLYQQYSTYYQRSDHSGSYPQSPQLSINSPQLTYSSTNSPQSLNSPQESLRQPGSKQPLFSTNHLPKSILKKDIINQQLDNTYSPIATPDSLYAYPNTNQQSTVGNGQLKNNQKGNGVLKHSTLEPRVIDQTDREKIENVKKIISEKIVNSLANYPNGYANVNKNKYKDTGSTSSLVNNNINNKSANNSILETHL